eukprot:CAMPEP_0181528500 /NCGR_PEP_ID=MMETSP1110-20121109/70570_1 /TAXON_ID=174948 /ORGANISM="Symbiodinium sp., Strain CCMP421" /LENGTH=271 /DNA_ID=CAMNT_0023659447 /DNA_START=161 /DNA_END=972 /DNA_ORIENTATION=-
MCSSDMELFLKRPVSDLQAHAPALWLINRPTASPACRVISATSCLLLNGSNNDGGLAGLALLWAVIELCLAALAADAAPQAGSDDAQHAGGPAKSSDVDHQESQSIACRAQVVPVQLRALDLIWTKVVADVLDEGSAGAHGTQERDAQGGESQNDSDGGNDLPVLLQHTAAQRQRGKDQHQQPKDYATNGATKQSRFEGRLVEGFGALAGHGMQHARREHKDAAGKSHLRVLVEGFGALAGHGMQHARREHKDAAGKSHLRVLVEGFGALA